ncbi:MAG: hypothetical protein J6S67_01915 [Methanobrevibacter sp.]|nr:hypothetical protein [Methanobrevibacter sp.]
MSKYTTEVRFICEKYAGLEESVGYNKVADIIANSRSKVFDFNYPIFDESYRSVLETKILKHFYLREICAETVGVWKHFLNMRMNEIMPYYNKLYNSELIEFNPLYDVDLTKDYLKDTKGQGSETEIYDGTTKNTDVETEKMERDLSTDSKTTSDINASKSGTDGDVRKNTRWDIYSDTPQGGLTNVENETYLTNARKIIDDGTGSLRTINETNNEDNIVEFEEEQGGETNRTRNFTGTKKTDDERTKNRNLQDLEDYIEHIKGKTGGTSFSKLLQEFRETFLNIDVMIINDLNDLFFGLW